VCAEAGASELVLASARRWRGGGACVCRVGVGQAHF
jgi:hypothetical protein